MKISIITLFPDMFKGFLEDSIVKRAQEAGAVSIEFVNLRDFAINDHGTVDDRPFGGGAGMVLMAEPLKNAIQSIEKVGNARSIATSARGVVYSQQKAKEYAGLDHLIIVAGHYEGYDERAMEYVDEEVSLGDFILTGGELPAGIIVDSIVRLLPGVLKKEEATNEESFFDVAIEEVREAVGEDEFLNQLIKENVTTVRLLEYPQYTRPQEFEGKKVPDVLVSGDPKKIRAWQLQQAFFVTKSRRPDLRSS